MARVLRLTTAAAVLTLTALGAATAVGQSSTTPAPPVTTAPTTPARAAAPSLDSLRLPKVVSAQQGHARFLVGVRLATPSRLTVQVLAAGSGTVVQTTTDAADRTAGRAYVRIEAVDGSGYQMLQGAYRVRMQATDGQGRVSAAVEAPFRLRLTTPRGQLDAYTIPLWRTFQRQAGTTTAGQLVAVVGPKGAAATAGLRRGDVITSLNGMSVATPGGWSTAVRALPAKKPVTVEFFRTGAVQSATLEAGADWEPAPNYASSLAVAVRRAPRTIAYSIAQARQLVDAGKITDAEALIDTWPAAWRRSAPGQLVQAEILLDQKRWKQALGAYNRARVRDRTMAAAEFGRGVALSSLRKIAPSRAAYAAASRLDPADPAAAGFEAYALLQEDRTPEAIAAATRAVRLDPRYADGFLPLGMGLLVAGERAGGVKALRRGLVLLEDADRAARLIAQHLDPTDR